MKQKRFTRGMTPKERFINYVIKTKKCWIWNGTLMKFGYGQINIGKKQRKLAHRFSYETYVGNIPIGLFVCHKCDNPSCVRPSHLFLGTAQDNMKDRDNKNRQAKGEKSISNRIFSDRDIRKIRKFFKNGTKQVDIAKIFNTSSKTIWPIVHNKYWKHI